MSKLLPGLRILLGLIFIATAAAKLTGQPMMVEEFGVLGFGQGFRYVAGLCELVGALLLIRSRTVPIGAAILVCVCVGAFAAQLLILHGDIVHTIVLGGLAGFVGWHYRPVRAGTAA